MLTAGLPFYEEHSKVMNEMYEKEIENPYYLRLCCAGFASTKVNRTDIEELMIGYNKEYENTAQELFTEFTFDDVLIRLTENQAACLFFLLHEIVEIFHASNGG